jgi:hypothetical protein
MGINQAEQELSFIKKVMEDSKQVTVDNGKYYILWGVLVSVTLFVNYGLICIEDIKGYYYGILWMIMMAGGAVASSVMKSRDLKKARVYTFAGKVLSSIWIAAGIAMFIVAFVGPAFKVYDYTYISSIISIILGVAYFVSGEIQQIKWLKLLSIGWWGGGIALFAVPGIHSYLIFGFMIIFLQTLPGIFLYNKWKEEISSSANAA